MLGNLNGIVELLLLERVLGRSLGNSDPFEMIQKVRQWDETETKKQKEKAAKTNPNKPVFSVREFTLALFGVGIPASLLYMQLLAYVWNMTVDAVHMMH